MRSRPRSSALRREAPRRDAMERLYALRRRFVAVVDAQGIAVKVLGGFSPWWSTASPQRIVAKKRLVKIAGSDSRTIMFVVPCSAMELLGAAFDLALEPVSDSPTRRKRSTLSLQSEMNGVRACVSLSEMGNKLMGAFGVALGIDPLMHTAFVVDKVPADQRELEHLTALFMSSPEFRERVRQMHGCLGELGACDFHVPMT
jgi:hypothetical protein